MSHSTLTETVIDDGVDFVSENVKRVEYDIVTHKLIVTYKRTGQTYAYADVDIGLFAELVAADSKQTFINKMIKPKHTCEEIA
jgi:hypothetical protein